MIPGLHRYRLVASAIIHNHQAASERAARAAAESLQQLHDEITSCPANEAEREHLRETRRVSMAIINAIMGYRLTPTGESDRVPE